MDVVTWKRQELFGIVYDSLKLGRLPVRVRKPMGEMQLEEGKRIALRLRDEARWAQRVWALWEALNGATDDDRREFREALSYLQLAGQVGFLQQLLVRDTLLTLFRISDQQNKDLQTLCAVSNLLQDHHLRAMLADRHRLVGQGCPDILIDQEANNQPGRIELICSFVSPRWSDQAPQERGLFDLRKKLKGIRDKFLAHSGSGDDVVQPSADEIREFLRITVTLVRNVELVFLGSAHTSEGQFKARLEEANNLLDFLEVGPIEEHKRHLKRCRRAGVD